MKNDHVFNAFYFRHPEGQAQYFQAYDAVFSSVHLKPEEIKIPTRFGLTHVNAFGPRGAPNLLLLHGMGASSTLWARNIHALCKYFRVYAPDTIDDLGKSRCSTRPRKSCDYVEWLKDVLRGLRIERAHIAGVSYGGWIACLFAASGSQVLDKTVCIAPAAVFQRIRPVFYIKAIPMVLIPFKKYRRFFMTRFFSWLAGASDVASLINHPLWRQQFCGATHARIRPMVPPCVLPDHQLKSIVAPMLLLVGEKEVIYDPQKVIDRAKDTVPNLTAELVPGGTHLIPWDKSKAISARMIAYLSDQVKVDDGLLRFCPTNVSKRC